MRRATWIGLGVAVLLAGCGGGGSSTVVVTTSPGATPLSKADYLVKADAICRQNRPERQKLQAEYLTVNAAPASVANDQKAAVLLRQAADLGDRTISELQALPKPAGDEAVLDNLYSLGTAIGAEVRHLADAIASERPSQVRTLSQAVAADGNKSAGIALGYGFKVCGQPLNG